MELSASGVKGRGSPFPWSTKASTGTGGKLNTKHQHLQSTSSFGDASTDYHDYAFTYGVGGPPSSSSPTTRSQFSPHPYSSGYKPGPLAGGSRSYGHGNMGSVGSFAGSASLAGSVDYHNNFDHGSFTSTPVPMMSVAQAAAMSVRGPAPVWEPYVPKSASTSPTPTTPGGTQGMSGMGMAPRGANMCSLGPPETLRTVKRTQNRLQHLTYQYDIDTDTNTSTISTKDCVKLPPTCFGFPNRDYEVERYRTLFQHTYVSTIPLFFLFNIFHLLDLFGFWLCIHSLRPSTYNIIIPFLQLSRSLLRMLSTTSFCVSCFPTSL